MREAIRELLEAREQTLSLARRVVAQPTARQLVKDGEPDAACNVVIGERRGMPQSETLVPEIRGGETCAERKESAAERLSQQQDVGFDSFMFASEEASGAAEARLHLVENKCSPMTRGKFPRPREIAGRRQVDAAFALDRLEEESGNLRSVASKARF